jgi:hypothetical protein
MQTFVKRSDREFGNRLLSFCLSERPSSQNLLKTTERNFFKLGKEAVSSYFRVSRNILSKKSQIADSPFFPSLGIFLRANKHKPQNLQRLWN